LINTHRQEIGRLDDDYFDIQQLEEQLEEEIKTSSCKDLKEEDFDEG